MSKRIRDMVDRLGTLKASIDMLVKKEQAICAKLKKMGDGRYEGELFNATVSTYDQSRLDVDAVKTVLTEAFIAAHTTKAQVCKVTVAAKSPKRKRPNEAITITLKARRKGVDLRDVLQT